MAKMTRNEIEDSREHLKAWFPNQSVERHTFNKICDQAVIAARPEEPFPSDREQAALWRDLVLLDPMDLMVIYGGAENDVVLLGKLKTWIEGKRKEQATPQPHAGEPK